MEQPSKEGSRCDNHGLCPEFNADIGGDALDLGILAHEDPRNGRLLNIEVLCALEDRFGSELVGLFVALHAWSSYTRSLRPVQEPELEAGCVRCCPHSPRGERRFLALYGPWLPRRSPDYRTFGRLCPSFGLTKASDSPSGRMPRQLPLRRARFPRQSHRTV